VQFADRVDIDALDNPPVIPAIRSAKSISTISGISRSSRVASFLGLDGFRWGWVAAWIGDNGIQRFDYSPTLERLLSYPHTSAMIDMPIGLPDLGHRACDREAQEILGPSVFTGVRRNFWTFETQDHANKYYRSKNQPCISAQLWSIRHKVRELDQLMSPERQRTLRETHPELVFRKLNNGVPLPTKHSESGRIQRIAILRKRGFKELDRWMSHRWGTGIGRDDIIDACACAIAARDKTERIPSGEPQVDRKNIKMEMWF
jgi:predicted RNase H-like nuclease